ncbi:hypothetical protein NDU88_002247 [Pleurodeles waltl]|uniref:Uncharacterized protein n=1 Tax=Pleurodeles waltl TaxID=8319 RepID=A0AAV7T2A9_PLEWA|nr:hypothetical protein NDU88_002247 [Pleurodeles waltl]
MGPASSPESVREGPPFQRPPMTRGGLSWRLLPLTSSSGPRGQETPGSADTGVSEQARPRRGSHTQPQDSARLLQSASGPSR